jgi:hypothetical protein
MKITNDEAVDKEVLFGTTVIATLEPDQFITIRDAGSDPLTFADAVTEWNDAHEDDRVITGGLEPYSTDTGLGTGSGGGTFVDLALTRQIRQHGPINAVRFNFSALGPVRLQIWRPDGAGHLNLVAETATFTPSATGEQLYVLPTPLTAQPGDVPGIWGDNATLRCKQVTTLESGWIAGAPTSVTLADIPTGYQYTRILGLTFYGAAPFLVTLGDSQLCAHGSVLYRPFLDGGTATGNPTGEPAHYFRTAVPALGYQNFSMGSQTWAHGAAYAAQVAALGPRAVLCNFGVNDVAASRTWTAISADMAAVKAALPSGCKMFVNEVMPWTGGTDAEALAIRELNDHYATWCAANGATLILCHDAMGQTRTSTGELDDLKTAYNFDGIHLTVPAGIETFTGIMFAALNSATW